MADFKLTQTGSEIQADLNLTENLQDAFSISSTYAVNDLVIYDSKLWKCHTAVSSAGAWTGTTNWTQIHLEDLGSNPATYDNSGTIKLGSSTQASQTMQTVSSTSGRQYAIQVNGDGRASVNVPWTDTTYSAATTSSTGLMPQLASSSVSTQTQSTKFLREDGTWSAPSYTSTGMSNPMTTSNDVIIGGSSGTPTRLGKGSNGEILRVNSSGNLAYGKNLPILDCTGVSPTYPSSDNTDGLIICLCDLEPNTKYNGYLYIVTGSSN